MVDVVNRRDESAVPPAGVSSLLVGWITDV
jgi:hypothetical protein